MGRRKSKNVPKQPDFVGIKNIGDTCFLNCVLQQIHMAPKVREAVLAIVPTSTISPEEDDDTYLYHLQNILKALDDKDEDIKTRKLYKESGYNSGFVVQDDAHGFFCALFQRIDDEKINELLRVRVIKTHLLKCKHLYTANEDLFALSIPMSTSHGTAPALSALLDTYFGKDDRRKKCFECDSKTQQGEIMKYLDNTPEILCIHINRIDGIFTEDIAVDPTLDISNLLPPEEKVDGLLRRNDRWRDHFFEYPDVKISYVENILSSSSSETPKTSLLSCRQFTFTVELDRSKEPREITILGLPKLRGGITELTSVKNFASYLASAHTCVVIIDNKETTISWASIDDKNVVEFEVDIQTRSNVVPKVQIQIEWQNGGKAISVDPEDPAPRLRYTHYSIAGLLIHSGERNGGHYFSRNKCRKGPHKGTWWEFDDSTVNKIVGGIEVEPSRMKCGAVMAIYEPTPPDQLPHKSSTEQPLKAAGDTSITSSTDVLPSGSSRVTHTSTTGGVTFSATSQHVMHSPNHNFPLTSSPTSDGAELVDLSMSTQTEVKSTQTEDQPTHIDDKRTQTEGDYEDLPPLELVTDSYESKQYEEIPTAEQIDPRLRKFLEMGNLLQYENYFKENGLTFDVLKDKFLSQNEEIQFDEDAFFDDAGISNRDEQRIFKLLLTDYPKMKESLVRQWTKWKQSMVQKLRDSYFNGRNNEAEICLQRLMFADVNGEFVRKDDAPGSDTL